MSVGAHVDPFLKALLYYVPIVVLAASELSRGSLLFMSSVEWNDRSLSVKEDPRCLSQSYLCGPR